MEVATPSLDGARIRLARGRVHIEKLQGIHDRVCDGFLDKMQRGLPDRVPAEKFFDHLDSLKIRPEVPDEVPVLVGEAVYNLRAALDYAVCQISKLQTPEWKRKRQRRNQFPIESTAEGFRARRETFLAGVSDGVVYFIEGKQPYNRCDWTRWLAEISNLDRHNQLVDVLQGFAIRFDESEIDGRQPPADGDKAVIWADIHAMLRVDYSNGHRGELLSNLRDIEFHIDQTLRLLDAELFIPKPAMYPGIRFPGEF
jgi:hypothetical protein